MKLVICTSRSGNIMLGSYITALSLLSDTKIKPTVPGIVIDMNGAIWQSILAGAGVTEAVTILDTKFSTAELELSGHLIFIPTTLFSKHCIRRSPAAGSRRKLYDRGFR